MKWLTLFCCLLACAALAGRAADPEPDTPKAELKKLRGTWKVTKRLVKGGEQKLPVAVLYTFKGDKLTVRAGGGFESDYTVKIDTKKKPHTIELIDEGGKVSRVGIYKIEKGEL